VHRKSEQWSEIDVVSRGLRAPARKEEEASWPRRREATVHCAMVAGHLERN